MLPSRGPTAPIARCRSSYRTIQSRPDTLLSGPAPNHYRLNCTSLWKSSWCCQVYVFSRCNGLHLDWQQRPQTLEFNHTDLVTSRVSALAIAGTLVTWTHRFDVYVLLVCVVVYRTWEPSVSFSVFNVEPQGKIDHVPAPALPGDGIDASGREESLQHRDSARERHQGRFRSV